MTKIETLQKLDFTKIPEAYQALTEGIKSLLKDYEQETDKVLFEQEAQDNIKQYLDMVKGVAPEAMQPVKSEPSKTHTFKDGIRWKLISKAEATQLFEKKDHVYGLRLNEESEALIESKEDLEAFEDFGVEQQVKKSPPQKPTVKDKDVIPLRGIAEKVTEQLAVLADGLEGQDETIIIGTQFEVDDALELEDDKAFVKAIQAVVEDFKPWEADISNKKIRGLASEQIQKLKSELDRLKPLEVKKAKPSPKIVEKVKHYEKDIEACRTVIREFNKEKRANQPDKPKPTRRTLLKNKVLEIIKLTPEALVGDTKVQSENRKLVKATLKGFMKNWGMTSIKQLESAIDQELDVVEEKVAEKESKELTQKWRKEIPMIERIMAFEKSHNKVLLQEAAEQIIVHIKEAIKRYQEDKNTAFKYLAKHLNADQCKAYLPKYIFEEMSATKTILFKPNKS